jgi:hypothetical protein
MVYTWGLTRPFSTLVWREWGWMQISENHNVAWNILNVAALHPVVIALSGGDETDN